MEMTGVYHNSSVTLHTFLRGQEDYHLLAIHQHNLSDIAPHSPPPLSVNKLKEQNPWTVFNRYTPRFLILSLWKRIPFSLRN